MNFTYETERLQLKILTENYAPAVLSFLSRNRDIFEPYEALKHKMYYTEVYQQKNLKLEYTSFLELRYIRFYVFEKGNGNDIIGTVSFSNILKSPYCSACIGYKFDHRFQHMGYATEAVTCAAFAMFRDAEFHRLEAYVMPKNLPSIKLLERIGFEYEGRSRELICVQGEYRDHLRYALINNFTHENSNPNTP